MSSWINGNPREKQVKQEENYKRKNVKTRGQVCVEIGIVVKIPFRKYREKMPQSVFNIWQVKAERYIKIKGGVAR